MNMTLTIALILSLLIVRGLRFDFGAKVLVLRNTGSITWLLLFVLLVWFFQMSFKHKDSRLKKCAAAFGIIVGAFHVIGGSLERMDGVAWIWQNRSMLLNFLNMLFSFICLYYCFAWLGFSLIKKKAPAKKAFLTRQRLNLKHVFIVWLVLLVSYIPWYLYFYPGILTYDSGAQVQDALSVNSLNDHNPAFVTLMIRVVLVPMMKLTDSIQISVGVCTFLQMMIVTFVFALSFVRICRYVRGFVLRALFFAWFAFYPVNNIYSITMWKDILFSVCLLGLTLCLDFCSEDERSFFSSRRNCFLLTAVMVLLPLLRHNGIGITVGMIIYLLLRYRKLWKRVIPVCGSALLIFGLWKLLILPALHAEMSPSAELLNVPIQQIARALYNHNHDVSPYLLDEFREYFREPEFWEEYNENIADPVKVLFRWYLFDMDPGRFYSLWAKLGKQYPTDYLEAFLFNNYGYWYPETTWWITGLGVIINVDIPGLEQAPIIRFGIIDKIYNWYALRQYNKTPVLPLFFKPGAVWWAWIFCTLYCLYQNRRKFMLFLPALLLWLPLQFSAVYCEFRYVYGLFVCLPLFMAASVSTKDDQDEGKLRLNSVASPGR